MSEIWIQPTGGALGADVYGVDLSKPVSDADFQARSPRPGASTWCCASPARRSTIRR